MDARLIVSAQQSIIDGRSNNLTLVNVLEQVASATFPFPIAFWTVVLLERSLEEPERPTGLRLNISMDGAELLDTALTCDFQGKPRTRLMIEIGSLIVPKPGRVIVQVLNEGRNAGKWWFEIDAISDPSVKPVSG